MSWIGRVVSSAKEAIAESYVGKAVGGAVTTIAESSVGKAVGGAVTALAESPAGRFVGGALKIAGSAATALTLPLAALPFVNGSLEEDRKNNNNIGPVLKYVALGAAIIGTVGLVVLAAPLIGITLGATAVAVATTAVVWGGGVGLAASLLDSVTSPALKAINEEELAKRSPQTSSLKPDSPSTYVALADKVHVADAAPPASKVANDVSSQQAPVVKTASLKTSLSVSA